MKKYEKPRLLVLEIKGIELMGASDDGPKANDPGNPDGFNGGGPEAGDAINPDGRHYYSVWDEWSDGQPKQLPVFKNQEVI